MIGESLTRYAEKTLGDSKWISEVMDQKEVQRIFETHKTGKTSKGSEIWTLLNLALWHKVWIEGESV